MYWADPAGRLVATSIGAEAIAVGDAPLTPIESMDALPLLRTFIEAGNPHVYAQLDVMCPTVAAPGEAVVITAVLPAGSPDAEVTFQVEGLTPVQEPVEAGTSSHAFAFQVVGTYRISTSSYHHGMAIVEVVVQ